MNEIKEERVSLGTAKLAKELGFDVETIQYLNHESGGIETETKSENWNQFVDMTSIPYQTILQRWLREIQNLQVFVYFHLTDLNYFAVITLQNLEGKWESYMAGKSEHKTYEQALEIGLLEALKLLKNSKDEN